MLREDGVMRRRHTMKQIYSLLLGTIFLLPTVYPEAAQALDFNRGSSTRLLSDRSSWLSTGADNSLEKRKLIKLV